MSERFMELAKAHQEEQEAQAVAAVRAQAAEMPPPDFDGRHCFDCSDPIPAKRLALGKFRCVSCQDTKERNSQLHRR